MVVSFEGDVVNTCRFCHLELVSAQPHLVFYLVELYPGNVAILLKSISDVCPQVAFKGIRAGRGKLPDLSVEPQDLDLKL